MNKHRESNELDASTPAGDDVCQICYMTCASQRGLRQTHVECVLSKPRLKHLHATRSLQQPCAYYHKAHAAGRTCIGLRLQHSRDARQRLCRNVVAAAVLRSKHATASNRLQTKRSHADAQRSHPVTHVAFHWRGVHCCISTRMSCCR